MTGLSVWHLLIVTATVYILHCFNLHHFSSQRCSKPTSNNASEVIRTKQWPPSVEKKKCYKVYMHAYSDKFVLYSVCTTPPYIQEYLTIKISSWSHLFMKTNVEHLYSTFRQSRFRSVNTSRQRSKHIMNDGASCGKKIRWSTSNNL